MKQELSQSTQIVQRAQSIIGKAQYAGLYGIALKSGYKNSVTDFDNNTYLDFLAGASAVSVGYAREDVIDAYVSSARQIMHSCFVYSPNVETIKLAEKITKITPGVFKKKVLFGMSASDSIDGSIKIARKYTGKMGVIAFHNAYHGNTGLAAQATGFPGIRNGFLSAENFFFVDFPRDEETANKSLQQTIKLFNEHQIAGFIIEPILGDGGNIVPPFNYFQQLKQLCNENNALLIDDETQSGSGRTGKWWAIEHFGVIPDILVAGKGVSGGYVPLSFAVGKAEIIDVLNKAQHVFTYSGHPPSCAVTRQVIEIIEKENLLQNAREQGDYLLNSLHMLSIKYKATVKSNATGVGLQLGLQVQTNEGKPLAALFGMRCLEKGLYVGYFGANNEVIRLHPPLTLTMSESRKALEIIDSVFNEYAHKAFPQTTIDRYKEFCLGLGSE